VNGIGIRISHDGTNGIDAGTLSRNPHVHSVTSLNSVVVLADLPLQLGLSAKIDDISDLWVVRKDPPLSTS
jgi:hypothetical protein